MASKLKQLEQGLDNHRIEFGKIQERMNTIQDMNSEKKSINRVNGHPAKNEDKNIGIEAPVDTGFMNHLETRCNFRADIDPKPDIQVRRTFSNEISCGSKIRIYFSYRCWMYTITYHSKMLMEVLGNRAGE